MNLSFLNAYQAHQSPPYNRYFVTKTQEHFSISTHETIEI